MTDRSTTGTLDIAALQRGYAAGAFTPADVLRDVYRRIAASACEGVWIHLVPEADALAKLTLAGNAPRSEKPLFGIPFAVKDNIDAAGLPTTAACPDFSYVAAEAAVAVARLEQAGAILIGKTNLDQFATGLVGTRSPYGVCRNAFDPLYISGGSSSGSAVAVAAGLVSFALGTDTAGSGRVPAGFQNIIGLKPTRGLVSARGVVPACHSLDCVSVLSLTCDDAASVLDVLRGFDAADAFSRVETPVGPWPAQQRVGIPLPGQLKFFGDAEYERLYREAVQRLQAMGTLVEPIDFTPLFETADLLYTGPWIAERTAALQTFLRQPAHEMLAITRTIIEKGFSFNAVETFEGYYRLRELRRKVESIFQRVDVLVVPTAGTHYTVEAVQADPITLNSNLGYYTNFVNLQDLSALAVPSGFTPAGLPMGITLIAQAFQERNLLRLADEFHRRSQLPLGATGNPAPA